MKTFNTLRKFLISFSLEGHFAKLSLDINSFNFMLTSSLITPSNYLLSSHPCFLKLLDFLSSLFQMRQLNLTTDFCFPVFADTKSSLGFEINLKCLTPGMSQDSTLGLLLHWYSLPWWSHLMALNIPSTWWLSSSDLSPYLKLNMFKIKPLQKGALGRDGFNHYLDCSNGFMGAYLHSSNCTL